MAKGKQTCKILKEIRKQIAAENDIKLVVEECTYQGDCKGTCPKCEAEVRYLERELEKRQRMGKAAVVAGLSVGLLGASQVALAQQPDPLRLDTTEVVLEGCVVPEMGEVGNPEHDVYQIVEQMPEFPNGEEAMMQYIAEQVKYPAEAKKTGACGRVFIGFIVESDGSLSDFKVLRGIGYGCDEEALRVVKSMPKWQPGMHRGKAVRVKYLVPVNFKLD
ncbi:MAG: energy transducer TonB [Bacteroidales bacterium]|nr:energy transducer TonB [Bacteroidales bacterium]